MVPGIDRRIHNATWVSELARVSAYLPDAATTELEYWARRPVHEALLQNVLTRRDERYRCILASQRARTCRATLIEERGRLDVFTSTDNTGISVDRKTHRHRKTQNIEVRSRSRIVAILLLLIPRLDLLLFAHECFCVCSMCSMNINAVLYK